ncbi:MAG: hypothetical protein CME64_15300 [Halobacteriovoraceae bacterium]|nr:hypothetical protein [Halobacteriovoraceae bacterium]|tara:strand:+ start:103484 stop:104395 length:912 start_codon:yes stop_codon:yes gene_type:complete
MISFKDFEPAIGDKEFGVSIGNFDGVHLGHQNLLKGFLSECKNRSIASVVFTFTPHPALYFDPAKHHLLTSYRKKCQMIKELGVDFVVELAFDKKLQEMTGKEFSEKMLLSYKNLKLLWVGHDFKFGKDKEDPMWIGELDRDLKFQRFPAFQCEKETVSSSLIRNYLMEGNVVAANRFLGRSFSIEGMVVEGKKLGRKLGFPTMNVNPNYPFLIPALGVYKVRCILKGKTYEGLMNLGRNPSIDFDDRIKIEVHLLKFSEDVYGEYVEVLVDDYVREERKFDDLEDLKAQITLDKRVYEKSKK